MSFSQSTCKIQLHLRLNKCPQILLPDMCHMHAALMSDRLTHAIHRAFHWKEFHIFFTDYCPLSLSRYVLSTTISSISKQSWKKISREREKEREYTHAKEEYVVSTNLNLCQTALWDEVEPSFLTRWFVTVGLIHIFIIYSLSSKKSNKKPTNWIIYEPIFRRNIAQ